MFDNEKYAVCHLYFIHDIMWTFQLNEMFESACNETLSRGRTVILFFRASHLKCKRQNVDYISPLTQIHVTIVGGRPHKNGGQPLSRGQGSGTG